MHIDRIPGIRLCPARNSTRMHHIEDDHYREHEQGVEYVEVSFVVEQGAVTPLEILHHPEDRSNHDEGTGSVQSPHVLFPGIRAVRLDRRDEYQPSVEADGDDHEEPEECELHEESDHDGVGTRF